VGPKTSIGTNAIPVGRRNERRVPPSRETPESRARGSLLPSRATLAVMDFGNIRRDRGAQADPTVAGAVAQ